MDSTDKPFKAASASQRRRWLTGARLAGALALVSLAAAGCGSAEETGSSAPASADMAQSATGATTYDGRVPLATAWQLTVELPGSTIPQLVRGHAARCIEAGPALCRVQTAMADYSQEGRGQSAYGRLVVLADPSWLVGFREQLQSDLTLAEGRAVAENVAMTNVADQLNRSDETLAAIPEDGQARREAERARTILEERVTLQTLEVSYQAILGPLDSSGARAVQSVLTVATSLLGYGLAVALALVLLGIPLALARWAFLRRRPAPGPAARPDPA